MKPIKITPENASKIEAALVAVNGKADSHTYTTYTEIANVADRATARLERILSNKRDFVGAEVSAESGAAVPNSYKYSRQSTRIRLDYRATGWFLTDIKRDELLRGAGQMRLTLTAEQDARAVEVLRWRYSIRTEA